MTPKQKRFVEEYCKDMNTTLAAIRSSLEFHKKHGDAFYVYFLCDSRNDKIFYVGKGTGERSKKHLIAPDGDNAKDRMIAMIQEQGGSVNEVFFEVDIDERAAFDLERKLISTLRKTGLTNIYRGTFSTGMTDKQRKFIEFYSGNATEAAIQAGYSKRTARSIGAQLLTKINIQDAIAQRSKEEETPVIASREERQAFWSETMRDIGQKMNDRLKASELLAKSNGDFLERVQAMVSTAEMPRLEVHFVGRDPETGEWERDNLDEEEE